MQFVIEIIRKVVVLVLLMEVVLQLQSGKQYEPYIKMLVGIMVVYSIVRGVFGAWDSLEDELLAPMQEFQWTGNWYEGFEEQAKEEVEMQTEDEEGVHALDHAVLPVEIEVQTGISPVENITLGEKETGE